MSVGKFCERMGGLAGAATPGPFTTKEGTCGEGADVEQLSDGRRYVVVGALATDAALISALLNSHKAMLRVILAAEVYVNRPNDANQFKLVAELEELGGLHVEEGGDDE